MISLKCGGGNIYFNDIDGFNTIQLLTVRYQLVFWLISCLETSLVGVAL